MVSHDDIAERGLRLLCYYRARVWWITSRVFVLTVIFTGLVLMFAPRYVARTKLTLLPTRSEIGFAAGRPEMWGLSPAALLAQTHAEILLSRTLAEEVARALAQDAGTARTSPGSESGLPAIVRRWAVEPIVGWFSGIRLFLNTGRFPSKATDPIQDIAQAIQGSTRIRNVPGSFVFEVSVTWRDAETAARVANLLAERYAKMTVKSNQEEMRTTRGYIEERIRETREDLAAMERKIEDYRVGEKLYATSTDAGAGRTDLGLGLEELSAYLRDLNAARVSWEQLDTRIAALKPYQTPAALAAVEAERAGLKTRQAAVEKVIVEQMAKLDKLPAKEAGLLDLYRGRMSKERALISLQDRLLDTRVAEAAQLGAARIIDKAIAPPFPEGPLLLRNAAAAILAGLLLSVAFMLLVETRRAGMRSREDLGDGSDSMVGLVPYVAGGGAGDPDTERSGRRREFLRGLVHGRYGTAAHRRIAERHMEDLFLRLAEGEGPRICMLISLRGGEGKTFLIERLARVAQGAGRKVLLVDANLNQPGLHRLFGKPQSKGLMEMLSGAEAARDVVVPVDPSVDLICGGLKRPHPDAKWALDEVKEELAVFALASRYDLVLIDTMSFRSDPSAARLLSLTSVPVCVFDATTSEKADLDDVRAQIGKKAQGLRFVLNKVMYGRDYGFVSGAEAAAADTTAEPGTPVAADGSRKGGGGTRTEGEKRGPIRHHTSLPIICCAKEDAPGAEHELRAISPDSLSCWGEERHEPGTRLHIGFPWLSPGVSVKGRVGATTAIATPRGRIRHLHEVNLAKESEVVLGTLMETVRRIEEYRRDQAKRCGRNLTAGEAAKEWAALSKMTGEAGSPSVS